MEARSLVRPPWIEVIVDAQLVVTVAGCGDDLGPAWHACSCGGLLRLRNCLDLTGDPITGFVESITHNWLTFYQPRRFAGIPLLATNLVP